MGNIRTRQPNKTSFYRWFIHNTLVDSKHFLFEEESRQLLNELMTLEAGGVIPIPHRNIGMAFVKTQYVLMINDPLSPYYRQYTNEEAEAFFKQER